MDELPPDRLPTWAHDLLRSKLGEESLTIAKVLKDTPFQKLVLGLTPTRALLAERGLFGTAAYELPPFSTIIPQPVGLPRAGVAEPGPRRPKRAAARGKPKPRRVKPRRAPPRRGPAARATPTTRGQAIEGVEGIGEAFGRQLRAAGVATIEGLLAQSAADLARKTGIAAGNIARWQAMARLQAVNGVGPQFSELLVRAGITQFRQLADETPASLAKRLQEHEAGLEHRVQGAPISEGLVAGWIPQAAELAELPHREGPYTLYARATRRKDGSAGHAYFFSKGTPKSGAPSPLPAGHEVGWNEANGLPFLRRSA
jgi:predicted flap endonuclease-1-like 5' DNA nuclease